MYNVYENSSLIFLQYRKQKIDWGDGLLEAIPLLPETHQAELDIVGL